MFLKFLEHGVFEYFCSPQYCPSQILELGFLQGLRFLICVELLLVLKLSKAIVFQHVLDQLYVVAGQEFVVVTGVIKWVAVIIQAHIMIIVIRNSRCSLHQNTFRSPSIILKSFSFCCLKLVVQIQIELRQGSENHIFSTRVNCIWNSSTCLSLFRFRTIDVLNIHSS